MLALIQAAANPTQQGNVTVSLSPTDVTTLKSLVATQKAKVAETEKGALSKLIADAVHAAALPALSAGAKPTTKDADAKPESNPSGQAESKQPDPETPTATKRKREAEAAKHFAALHRRDVEIAELRAQLDKHIAWRDAVEKSPVGSAAPGLADILAAARMAEQAIPEPPAEDAMDKFIRKFTHAIAQTPAAFARQSDLQAALDSSYKGTGRVLRRSPRKPTDTASNTDTPDVQGQLEPQLTGNPMRPSSLTDEEMDKYDYNYCGTCKECPRQIQDFNQLQPRLRL